MPDDKRVMLGWMSNWDYANNIPTSPWRSAMALPREVKLTQTSDGPRLTQSAVKQVEKLGGKVTYKDKKGGPISAGTHPLPAQSAGQVQQVDITFAPGTATKIRHHRPRRRTVIHRHRLRRHDREDVR